MISPICLILVFPWVQFIPVQSFGVLQCSSSAMARDGPNWHGLLKWSLSHSDGTCLPRNISEEDRKWFMEAMQAQAVDVIKRMKEITLVMKTPEHVLEAQGVTTADLEDMLDELQEHVESIDMANGERSSNTTNASSSSH